MKIRSGPTWSPTQHQEAMTGMLVALGNKGKHIYGGTVPGAVIAKRRAAGKRAKRARRLSRR